MLADMVPDSGFAHRTPAEGLESDAWGHWHDAEKGPGAARLVTSTRDSLLRPVRKSKIHEL